MTDRLLRFRLAVSGSFCFSIAAPSEAAARLAMAEIIAANGEGLDVDLEIPDTYACRPTVEAGPFAHGYFAEKPIVTVEDVDDGDDDTESTPEDRPC